MVLERLRGKEPNKVRKPIYEDKSSKLEKAPWYVKMMVAFRAKMSEQDPFKVAMVLIAIALIGMIVFGFLFPWIEVMQEFTYKMPVMVALSALSIGWFLGDFMNKSIREKICEVTFEGQTLLVDNQKVDVYEGGELIYLVNYYGKPRYNIDEANLRRYGKQQNIFIPRNVIAQFGSVLGRRAKAFPDCKIQKTHMKEVDQGVLYIPRKLSESRLLKKLEAAEQNLMISNDLIEKYKADILKVVDDLRGHEAEQLKSLIKEMSGLQEAFMGTPSRIDRLVKEQMYRGRYYGSTPYSPYSSYRPYHRPYSEYGKPSWEDVAEEGGEQE
jgi:hypothetical protein